MFTQPQSEHHWLTQLVGDWTYEGECVMGPEQPPMKMNGGQTVRAIGGLWILCEGSGELPDGGKATTLITLGFDPDKNSFVGTFIGSMGGYLWIYNGSRDASGNILTLDAEGPRFDQTGLAKYQDIIEVKSPDHYTLSSQILGDDGKWVRFMTSDYRRTK